MLLYHGKIILDIQTRVKEIDMMLSEELILSEELMLSQDLTFLHPSVSQLVNKLADQLRFLLTCQPFSSGEVGFWLEVYQTVFWKRNHFLNIPYSSLI